MSQSLLKKLIYPLLLVISTLIVYSNSFNGPFVFDDSRIYRNPHIKISELTVENLLQAGLKSKPLTRPVANISFAVNYYFNQLRVKGYHVVNLLIHITTGVLFYFLASFILDLSVVREQYGESGSVAFLAALIWLVHPIQTQSVLYIVQRMNELAGMFYLAAFLCYVWARYFKGRIFFSWLLLLLSLLFGLLAVGAKENAATLPFFLLLYEFYFVDGLSKSIKSCRFVLTSFAAFILLAALIYLYLGAHPLSAIFDYSARDFSLTERLMTEFRVVVFYISLIFLPHPARLNLNHHFSISLSPIFPMTTMLSMLVIIALFGGAIVLAKRDRLISFAIFWFLGNLLIESSVIPLELVFEHRLYLPFSVAILAIVMVCRRQIRDSKTFWVLLLAIPILFSIWTYHRIQVWQDDVTFWSDCYAKSPQSVRSANSLALSFEKRGNYTEAARVYKEALAIDPDSVIVLTNLGGLFFKENQISRAESFLVRALEIEQDFPPALFNLAIVRQKQGRWEVAEKLYLNFIQKEPDSPKKPKIFDTIGRFQEEKGDLKRALKFYDAAIKADPGFALAHNDIGIVFARNGDIAGAIRHFQKALEINGNYLEASKNLQRAILLKSE